MIVLVILQLWTSYITPRDRALAINGHVRLWGNWQSCLDDEGDYAERIFTYVQDRGVVNWTLHMGPYDEFALYRGAGPADTNPDGSTHTHVQAGNLLGTAYHFRAFPTKTGRNWSIPSLALHVNIVEAGGSRQECESFTIKVEALGGKP